MELRFADDLDPAIRGGLGYEDPADALFDPRGRTVRCTPRRRTVAGPVIAGRTAFRKYRDVPGAAAEWDALHRLAALGFAVPAPVCLAQGEGRSVVVVLDVPGRPMDAQLAEAAADVTRRAAAVAFACEVVAPMVRRLHDAGLYHRDMYWNHVFAQELDARRGASLIDVERVFAPHWRTERWRVKDLAGLLSSLPAGYSLRAQLRFLFAYLGGRPRGWRDLAVAVRRKARRIRAHQPKFG